MKQPHNILLRLVAMMLLVVGVEAQAQKPTLTGRFSKDSIEVGDQVEYILDIEVDRAVPIGVPQFGESLSDAQKQSLQKRKTNISTFTEYQESDFELIREYDIDTLKEEEGRMLHLRKRYALAAMETGDLVFSPAILYSPKNSAEPDTLYADSPIALHVKPYEELDTLNFLTNNAFTAPGMMPSQGPIVDTTLVNNHLQLGGLSTQRDMPFIRDEIEVTEYEIDNKNIIIILSIVLAAIIIGFCIYLFIHRSNRRMQGEILLPPHVEANKALEELHHRKLWQNDKHNLYYTLLTDILRRYISRRWNIRAMEYTTNETMEALRQFDIPNESRLALLSILRTADMAKFAKAKPEDELNEECYTMAYYFVENTKIVEVDSVEGKEDITIDTKIGD